MSNLSREQEAYFQLSYYTLSHPGPSFIHQLIIDTYAAQQADQTSKPIYSAFALAGLYLHNECGYTGKEVQKAHMRLAQHKESLPIFNLPTFRGNLSAAQVLNTKPGQERDVAIEEWSRSTWKALSGLQPEIINWLRAEQEI